MASVRFRVTLPERLWIGKISREYEAAEFRVLSGIGGDERASALVETTRVPVDDLRESAERDPSIDSFRVVMHGDGKIVFRNEATSHETYDIFRDTGTMPEYPVTIRNGSVDVSVTETRERIVELKQALEGMGAAVEIVAIRTTGDSSGLLTERQAEIVDLAVEEGYYEVPRRCSITRLAELLDVSKSTVSGVLHRAESRLVHEYSAASSES
ncbi:helix-turn-helix domain-containing protein [Haladaptatus sp.]|uniref:helix-turn-helix domain-containing protein n=1 Tax=Haladaptatus sp. TaxID=1973141 RepID=UPI003C3B3BE6